MLASLLFPETVERRSCPTPARAFRLRARFQEKARARKDESRRNVMNPEAKKPENVCPLCGRTIEPGQPTVKVEGKPVHRVCLQDQTSTQC